MVKRKHDSTSDIQQFFSSTFHTLTNLRDDSGRNITADYYKLPSKKAYPDYYQIIKKPISLSEIKQKINSKSYRAVSNFLQDFKLLSSNSEMYNDPSSSIAINGKKILEFVNDQVNEFQPSSSSGGSSINTASSENLNEKLKIIINKIINHKFKDGILSSPFMDLPDRKSYPDYYKLIKQPISFNIILKKIDQEKYSTTEDIQNDLQLMFKNAQTYNDDKSLIYEDSVQLQELSKNLLGVLDTEPESESKNEEKEPKKKLKLKLNVKENNKIKLNLKLPEKSVIEKKAPEKDRKRRKKNEKIVELKVEEPEVKYDEENDDGNDDDNDDVRIESEKNEEVEEETQPQEEVENGQEAVIADAEDEDAETSKDKAQPADEPVDAIEKVVAEQIQIGESRKRSPQKTPLDAHIQQITISSSPSTYPLTKSNNTQANNAISPLVSNYEFKFEANDYTKQSYVLILPPATSTVTIQTTLNEALDNRDFLTSLEINNEKVTPLPSANYAKTGKDLEGRYDVKLCVGLNMIVFNVRVKDVEEKGERFTRSALREQIGDWELERFIFWVSVLS